MIDYVSEDQPGLDPSLPIAKRKISIQLKNPALGEPINIALKSNFADGGKEYPKVFKLTEKAIDLTTLVVKINGQATDDYKLSKENAVIFKSAPRAKSKIVVTYEYANAKDSIHLAPVKISKMAILQTLKIYLNGVRAEAKHFTVTAVEESYSAVNLTDEVFADKDPFNIQFLKKLNVKVEYSVKAK